MSPLRRIAIKSVQVNYRCLFWRSNRIRKCIVWAKRAVFFLGAIAKLQKKFTISFAMPVRPSFRKEQFRSRWTDFLDLFCLNSFRKSGDKIQFFIKIEQEFRVLYMKTTKYFWSNLPKFFLKWELFQTKVVEKIKTHILLSTTSFFFSKIVPFMR